MRLCAFWLTSCWTGTVPPIIVGRGKTHRVTYADILRDLEPLNEGRDQKDRITYHGLWVHAKRHYDFEATAGYRRTLMAKEFKESLRR